MIAFVETAPPKKYMKAKPSGIVIADMMRVRIVLSSIARSPLFKLRGKGVGRTGTT